MEIRKLHTVVEEILREARLPVERPITRVAAVAVVANPLANQPGADISPLIEYGTELGRVLAERIMTVIPRERLHSFGKAAIIGEAGELEHAAALIHPTFGKSVRTAIHGGAARIPSTKKIGGVGTSIDIPLCYKEAQTVASHFDAMTIAIPDAPRADEFVVALVFTDGGRPHPRIPGLRLEEVKGEDGIR